MPKNNSKARKNWRRKTVELTEEHYLIIEPLSRMMHQMLITNDPQYEVIKGSYLETKNKYRADLELHGISRP